MFEVVQTSVKVLNITQNKESRRGVISGGAYNRMYFVGLQVDGPIT